MQICENNPEPRESWTCTCNALIGFNEVHLRLTPVQLVRTMNKTNSNNPQQFPGTRWNHIARLALIDHDWRGRATLSNLTDRLLETGTRGTRPLNLFSYVQLLIVIFANVNNNMFPTLPNSGFFACPCPAASSTLVKNSTVTYSLVWLCNFLPNFDARFSKKCFLREKSRFAGRLEIGCGVFT